MIIPFATNSYKASALPISAQRLVNMYAEREPPDAKTAVAVFGCPGLVQLASLGNGPIRGFTNLAGILYVLSGGTLYSVAADGTATDVGSSVTGTDVVSMDNNGTQIVIRNGTLGYVYTVVDGFQLITDPDFHQGNTVTFVDQRFAFDKAASNEWFISETLDGTTYDALAIASAESRPDYVKAVGLIQQTILVFGEKTIEPWQDVGAANFPFERLPGVVIERGLLAPYAFCKADNAMFFMGENRVLYKLAGLTPQRISNHAIETEWETYAKVSDCFMFSYIFNGHEFVNVTFPSQPATWVFDIATGLPHERVSWDSSGNSYGRWRGNCYINIYGRDLIGDAFSGKIGYLDNSTFTEFGNTMQGMCVSPPLHSDRKRVFVSNLELDMETGVGLTAGQGSDPQVMLERSVDGGRTFGTPQRWQSLGGLGAYNQRLRWPRLGSGRNVVFRVTISDPVKRTLITANADVTVGI